MGNQISSDLLAGKNTVQPGGATLRADQGQQEKASQPTSGVRQSGGSPDQSVKTQGGVSGKTYASSGKPGANNVRLKIPGPDQAHAQAMKSEDLAKYVEEHFRGMLTKLVQLEHSVKVLWDRFDGLKGGETILGCRTKAEFCEKRLGRSIRAVQYMIYGRTPKKAEKPRKKVEAESLSGAHSPLLSPTHGTLEELSQRINQMADTDEIEGALRSFFEDLAQSLLERHPCSPTSRITVEVSRNGKRRMDAGDWVEYGGGNSLLAKQAGQKKAVGWVVGLDKLNRPRVRWHNGTGWTKPFSLLWGSYRQARVLFDYQAAKRFPKAYHSYPVDSDGASKSPLKEGTASQAIPHPDGAIKPLVREGNLRITPAAATQELIQISRGSGKPEISAIPPQEPKTSTEAGSENPPLDPVPESAIGEERSGPAEAICDEPCSFSPGEWITFDSTSEYLARFEGKEGNRFIVTRFNKVSKQWSTKRTYATFIERRLSTDEVRKKFPGALEAWPAERPENKTPKPTRCSSSKPVSGNATQPPTNVTARQVPE